MNAVVSSKLIVGQGPLHVERLLLAEIDRLCAQGVDQLHLPVRVIVPSAALRRHVNRRLVQHRGRSVVGVMVQSLLGVAQEIVERAGRPVTTHEAAIEALVRRLARAHPVLQRGLDHLEDGYGVVVGSVRDLLDAGLETVHAEALFEKLDDLARSSELSSDRLDRARAVIEVAEAVARLGARAGIQRVSGTQLLAREVLQEHGAGTLPARAVLVHGFADLTALAGDLLAQIVTLHGATVLVDRPRDPDGSTRPEPGAVFLDRFLETFSGLRVEQNEPEIKYEPGTVRVVATSDMDQQIRWVSAEIRGLLDSGVPAEEIAVVARDLAPVMGGVLRHFDRVGVPFSVLGATVHGAGWQSRVSALMDLAKDGVRASLEIWSAARIHPGGGAPELGTALKVLGLRRLVDLAELSTERLGGRDVSLPVARSASSDDGSSRSCKLPVTTVIAEMERGRAVVANLGEWPDEAPAGRRATQMIELLELLGWSDEDPIVAALSARLVALADELQPLATVELGTWLELARRSLTEEVSITPGGAGAGVQVLTVMEARAMTFGHLFLVGCERGLFPRSVVEDPLLPDTVRGRLCEVLPQMPVKSRGWAEDSFLFAQLMACAGTLRCSWSRRRDGKESARSPFLERLLFREEIDEQKAAGRRESVDDGVTTSCFDLAVAVALAGLPRAELKKDYASALVEGWERAGRVAPRIAPDDLAEARLELLEVVDPPLDHAQLSPFWGFVGADVGGGRSSVSLLESVAVCPWRGFVERVIGVQRIADPSLDYPEFESTTRGTIVHGVLHAIVRAAQPGAVQTLARASTGSPAAVPWPGEQRLAGLIVEAVDRELARRRLVGAVARPLIAELVMPFLEMARAVEWGEDDTIAAVLGAELEGQLDYRGLALGFRVDRVDEEEGSLVFVDYKTGKPLHGQAVGEDTRRKKLLAEVRSGRTLQVAAYVHAAGGRPATGRYVFLYPGPGFEREGVRVARATSDDGELEQVFAEAVSTICDALRLGTVFPRTDKAEGAKYNLACERWCGVAEACIRGDTDQRRRLQEWMSSKPAESAGNELTARRLWRLGGDP